MTETITNVGKLIKRSESIKIARFLSEKYPDDAPYEMKEKLTQLLKFIRNARLHKIQGYRVRMILRGRLPEFIEKRHLFKPSTWVADWSDLA